MSQSCAKLLQSTENEFPYLSNMTASKCLTKIINKIRGNMYFLLRNNNLNKTLELLCRVGVFASSDESSIPTIVLENILRILQDVKLAGCGLEFPFISEFFQVVFGQVKTKQIKLSESGTRFILNNYPVAVEDEVLSLLAECYQVKKVSNLMSIKSALLNSQMVPICSSNSVIFQHVFSILSYSWLNSEGHPAVGYLLSEFVASCSSKISIVSFFPENVLHLAVLFSLAPPKNCDYFESSYLKHQWNAVLRALELCICNKEEIFVLMAVFPLRYKQFLIAANDKCDEDAINLLKILWNSDQNSVTSLKIKDFLTSPWLYHLSDNL